VRGDVHELRAPRGDSGHEQQDARLAVVVQSDDLPLSTWLVAPTSTSTSPTSFRPEIDLLGKRTRVQVEQTAAVDPARLGRLVGRVTLRGMQDVDAALRLVLGLD
jgi:mRNA interferase MazF